MSKYILSGNLRIFILSVFLCLVLVLTTELEASDKTLIFPLPQKIELTASYYALDEKMTIIIPQDPDKNDVFLARFLVRELSDKYNIAVKISQMKDLPASGKYIIMGRFDNPLLIKYLKKNNLVVTGKDPGPEGYILDVSSDRIIIAGSDDAGAYFGLQSLRQLIDRGDGKSVQGLKVTDWPAFPFRAIRLFIPGPENISFFKRFLRDFMSLYKYNKVILEMNCMRLDRHPEVNAGWIEFSKYMLYTRSTETVGLRGEQKNSTHYDAGDGYIIEKNDVQNIVNYAKENFIEVIPEIPSLTHGYYLLTRHPELAEYPGDVWPDTYCPSNPESYKLLFDVFDEYIEAINPKMINIGHDEWWGAPLNVCPLCKGKDFSELFAGDINKIYSYLNNKGIKVAMWGDYLLERVRNKGPQQRKTSTGLSYQTPGATRPEIVKDAIPKDILVLNWFWGYKDEITDLEVHNFGFKQAYGNLTPAINNWSERVKKIDLVGGAPSYWAATNEFNIGKDQILDFLGCSNYLWSNHILDKKELPGIVNGQLPDIRSKLSLSRLPSRDGAPVVSIDISSAFNLSRNSKLFNLNLNSLKSGKVMAKEKVFDLVSPSVASGKCAIAAGTKGFDENPLPVRVDGIKINEDVSSLIFLHACALPSKNQNAVFNIPDYFDTADLLGWYEIVYEDAYKVIVPVQYGVNILEWNPGREVRNDLREIEISWTQNSYCYNADPVVCSQELAPITFYACEWINPRFGKKIAVVNLCGTVDYQASQAVWARPKYAPLKSNAIILAGLSMVKKREPYIPKADSGK